MSTIKPSRVELSDDEWKRKLSSEEYNVLRVKGTERAFTGEYDKFAPKGGYFACRGCNTPLYSAAAKFKSGCGWPAFDRCYRGAVYTRCENAGGSTKKKHLEILCGGCDGHLGHVFHNEKFTETNERHCVNSVSVKYVSGDPPAEYSSVEGPVEV